MSLPLVSFPTLTEEKHRKEVNDEFLIVRRHIFSLYKIHVGMIQELLFYRS